MTTALFLHSERFPPSGGLAAQGALNLLGRPKVDLLTLLLRETGQNSWDALRDGSHPVDVRIRLRRLDNGASRTLRDRILLSRPLGLPLDKVLRDHRTPLRILEISDRNTVGLGGPTRADVAVAEGTRLDFVEFMRNFGQVQNAAGSGGTYGYGRTSAYLASRAQTIIVYTRWHNGTDGESRLMASALGDSFKDAGWAHTGRHWWGVLRDGIAEPVVATDADDLARQLGLEVMSGDETGTDLIVVAPDLDDSPDYDFGSHLRGAVLWNLWPKLVSVNGEGPHMRYSAEIDDSPIELPEPGGWAPTKLYVETYRRMLGEPRGGNPTFVNHEVMDGWGRVLGHLGLQKDLISRRDDPEAAAPYTSPPHRHVALLRKPRLVVQYREGRRLESDDYEYAGVFVANETSEEALRQSETPVHDDWTSESLSTKADKIIVNAVLRRTKALQDEFAVPNAPVVPSTTYQGLGALAHDLGLNLLPLAEGDGPGPDDPKVPTKPGSRKARIHVEGQTLLTDADGRELVAVEFTVKAAPDSTRTRVTGMAGASLDGGAIETEPPAGSPVPSFAGWGDGSDKPKSGGSVLVGADDASRWTAYATLVPGVITAISLTAEAE